MGGIPRENRKNWTGFSGKRINIHIISRHDAAEEPCGMQERSKMAEEFKIPEGIPGEMKAMVEAVLAVRFPELSGEPESGKWYRISPEGCVTSTGTPWHATFRKGEENRLIIQFGGGGVSWSEYMAARPMKLVKGEEQQFYFPDTGWAADAQVHQGICLKGINNPFSDWSVLVLPYSSGDFHCGTGDFPYTALDGTGKVLHHHGYTNYRKAMEAVLRIVPEPERILVCGESAGGFGTALLTDDVMGLYPKCRDVICCVDSALTRKEDWGKTAAEVWKAPKEIAECLQSDNLTLDMLKALHRKRDSRVKILFLCSVRDMALTEMQDYIHTGRMKADRAAADIFQANLLEMCRQMRQEIPGCGLFIFDKVMPGTDEEAHLTVHTILMENLVYETLECGCSAMEWLWRAVQGEIVSYGTELCEKTV